MTIAKGKVAGPRNVLSVRPLTREDLSKLEQPRATLTTPQRLRESHHQVARLIALGLSYSAIADATGYTPTRIGQLAAAPAMQELVARLRERADQTTVEALTDYNNLVSKRRTAAERHMLDYIDELDSTGEIMPVKIALALASDGADRTGYGKMSTRVNVNEDFAAKLERAIGRSGKVIDVTRAPSPQSVAVEGPSRSATQNSPLSPTPIKRRA